MRLGLLACVRRAHVAPPFPFMRWRRFVHGERRASTVSLPPFISVRELARRLGHDAKSVASLVCSKQNRAYHVQDASGAKYRFRSLGAAMVDRDAARQVCERLGRLWEEEPDPAARLLAAQRTALGIDELDVRPRRPVVVIMGHVDHGKTTLLDALTGTRIAPSESGGITQRVYAAEALVDASDVLPTTFLDTPGHAHFFRMREDTAALADAALLLVASDEGLREQTEECAACLEDMGLPVLALLSKADIAARQLSPLALRDHLEARGVPLCGVLPVSAHTGEGVPELRAALRWAAGRQASPPSSMLPRSAVAPRLRGAREPGVVPSVRHGGLARGLVVDAVQQRGMGLSLAVLLHEGTLRVGDEFVCELTRGKVRALRTGTEFREGDAGAGRSRRTQPLTCAEPGQVVLVSGVHHNNVGAALPPVGEPFLACASPEQSREVVEYREALWLMEEACVSGQPPRVREQGLRDQRWHAGRAARDERVLVALRARGLPPPLGQAEGSGLHDDSGEYEHEYVEVEVDGQQSVGTSVLGQATGDAIAHVVNAPATAEEQPDLRAPVVVKADSASALAALCDVLEDEAPVKIIRGGVGELTDSDLEHARLSKAAIYCFNVRPSKQHAARAKARGVQLYSYQVLKQMAEEMCERHT